MKFEVSIMPRLDDYNRHGKVSYEAILHMLGTGGQRHSLSVKDDVLEGSMSGIAWILTEWNVHIVKRPEQEEEYTVTTWSKLQKTGIPSSIVAREYILCDSKGETCVVASSKFVLMDYSKGTIAKIDPEMMEIYKPEPDEAMSVPAGKIKLPKEFDYERKVALRREDIDFNGHVHNSRYLVYALESLPEEDYLKDDFTDIRIEFRKPVLEHDNITVKTVYSEESKAYICAIYNQEDKICSVVKLSQNVTEN